MNQQRRDHTRKAEWLVASRLQQLRVAIQNISRPDQAEVWLSRPQKTHHHLSSICPFIFVLLPFLSPFVAYHLLCALCFTLLLPTPNPCEWPNLCHLCNCTHVKLWTAVQIVGARMGLSPVYQWTTTKAWEAQVFVNQCQINKWWAAERTESLMQSHKNVTEHVKNTITQSQKWSTEEIHALITINACISCFVYAKPSMSSGIITQLLWMLRIQLIRTCYGM